MIPATSQYHNTKTIPEPKYLNDQRIRPESTLAPIEPKLNRSPGVARLTSFYKLICAVHLVLDTGHLRIHKLLLVLDRKLQLAPAKETVFVVVSKTWSVACARR